MQAEYCNLYNQGSTRCSDPDGNCLHKRRHRCEKCNGRHPKIGCQQGDGKKKAKGEKGKGKGGKGGKNQRGDRGRSRSQRR